MEKKRIPKRRFREFLEAGEWESKPLGKFFTERSERSSEGELISVTISSGVVKSTDVGRHDTSSEDKSNYKRVEPMDIAYNSMRMWQGASGVSSFSGILSPAYTVCIPEGNTDSVFFSYVFKKPAMIHQFCINSQGLTKDTWNLKFPAFSHIEALAPTYREQQKIGNFCRRLDTLIALHQQKLSKLKDLKQAYLTEMFPAPGEKRPRRRFKGFSGDWKKSKFGDVVTQADIKVNPWQENVDLYSVTIEDGLIAKSDRYNRESLVKKQDIFSLVCPRQIVYNPMNMTLGSIGYNANNFDVAVSGYYTILSVNDGIDPYYLYTYMKLRNTLSVYSVYATGSLKEKQRLQFPTLVGIPCILPELEEQKKIAHVALLLNERIIKAKNSLEKFQFLKQAYLSELFV